MEVANVACGYSFFHDEIWGWLGRHRELFTDHDKHSGLDSYDFIRAWGVLVLAGCEIQRYDTNQEAPTDYAEYGVRITFEGTSAELVNSLNQIL